MLANGRSWVYFPRISSIISSLKTKSYDKVGHMSANSEKILYSYMYFNIFMFMDI